MKTLNPDPGPMRASRTLVPCAHATEAAHRADREARIRRSRRSRASGASPATGGSVWRGQSVPAAEILAGRHVGIRIEPATLMFFDLDTRELLRVRPNPLTAEQIARLRGSRPAGPPHRPANGPVRVQRRASSSGLVMVVGQKVALGRVHAYRTVTIAVSDTTLAIELDDGETRIVRRTTTLAVRNIKANRPWTTPSPSENRARPAQAVASGTGPVTALVTGSRGGSGVPCVAT